MVKGPKTTSDWGRVVPQIKNEVLFFRLDRARAPDEGWLLNYVHKQQKQGLSACPLLTSLPHPFPRPRFRFLLNLIRDAIVDNQSSGPSPWS